MANNTARGKLDQLIQAFSHESLVTFFRTVSDQFQPFSESYDSLAGNHNDLITNIQAIGQIEFSEEERLVVVTAQLQHDLTSRTGKKQQYELGKNILKTNYYDAGIFVFYDQNGRFRFSLIRAIYRGQKRDYSNFRRYTYFVSKEFANKTFLNQIGRCDFSGIEAVQDAFSVEAVNKEFYIEIATLFTKLTGGWRKIGSKRQEEKGCIKLPGTKNETVCKEFAVRLIGRLIFCWFLKKKTSKAQIPLVAEEILSTKAMDTITEVGGYYHGVLEPLFFELLNTPAKQRRKKYQEEPWAQTPFLNGGLFTPHIHDFYEWDESGYSQYINTLKVPDDWIKELLGAFERYNFTIDENTPIDVELSIEPEMLGRIFENLLAEINPETGETARKATGSYYTPRAIVDYMVDESLRHYLLSKTKVPEAKIADLLSYSEANGKGLTESQSNTVIQALHEVKIVDPACGSGAFCIGILQKILLVLQKLDPDSKKWLAKMLEKVPDPLVRKELKKKIKVPNYLHKLGVIRDCIFGVDIQPVAVEIAKLRCFLSLIVDEEVDDKSENRGIEHLPNLEFKFVCANSLIGLPEKTQREKTRKGTYDQSVLFEAEDKIDALKELRESYLTAMPGEKAKIEDDFRSVQSDMFQHSLAWGGKDSQTLKLSQWNPFSDEACSWFDPEWMFGVRDGFDVAIGNPPYIRHEQIKEQKPALKQNFPVVFTGTADIYTYFYAKSVKILAPGGMIVFITSNKWLRANYGKKIRAFLARQCRIRSLTDFQDSPIFAEATAYPMILVGQKTATQGKTLYAAFPSRRKISMSKPSCSNRAQHWATTPSAAPTGISPTRPTPPVSNR